MKKFISLSLLLLLTHNLQAQEVPPFATVTDLQIDGSGCEAGSANAVVTSDLGFLSVLYDKFSAEIGQGTANPTIAAQEKRCTILVKVQIPAGWNFQFDSVQYSGFVALPNKATAAYQLITVETTGGRGVGFGQNLLQGPKTQNFSTLVRNQAGAKGILGNSGTLGKIGDIIGIIGGIKNTVDAARSGGLLGCSNQVQDAVIKIKATIGVRNLLAGVSRPAVKIVMDATDASFAQNLKFNWRRCP